MLIVAQMLGFEIYIEETPFSVYFQHGICCLSVYYRDSFGKIKLAPTKFLAHSKMP